MKLGLHQSARLDQRLVQSPQMIQAMKILQLGTLDLQERIDQELVENPMLEEAAPSESEAGDAERERKESESTDVERMLDDLERIQRDFGDGTRATAGDGDEGDRKLAALANAPDVPHSMAEALHEELAFLDLGERERAIAEFLISSLDERGYLLDTVEDLAADCPLAFLRSGDEADRPPPRVAPEESPEQSSKESTEKSTEMSSEESPEGEAGDEPGPDAPESDDELSRAATRANGELPHTECEDEVAPEEIEAVLIRLRGLIHPALGAHDLREALLLQIDHFEQDEPLLRAVVSDHLEDVQQNRLPRIAKATGADMQELKEALEHLKRLDPSPGADYGGTVASTIVPDVIVEYEDGDYQVRLERERVPRLQLSPTYRRLLESSEKGDDAQVWLKKRLESARWFIDAVAQRQSTLERIALILFRHQRPFLDKGREALQPLRMQEVADEVGVHISTVSRAVNGKYAQTPRGIFPLKFFFSGGTTKGTGEVASQVSIQQNIKELVEAEDASKPLSDEEIAARLFEKHNVKIARRTVTKYRKMLDIPSSSVRKTF